MNPLAHDPFDSTCLVEIIELKWLLTGYGVPLHVERLQADQEYARKVLQRAAGLPNEALRTAASRLHQSLGLGSDQDV